MGDYRYQVSIQDYDAMVEGVQPDTTPFGVGGDWCPFCGSDWKQPHDEDCTSPYASRDNDRVALTQGEVYQADEYLDAPATQTATHSVIICQNRINF